MYAYTYAHMCMYVYIYIYMSTAGIAEIAIAASCLFAPNSARGPGTPTS